MSNLVYGRYELVKIYKSQAKENYLKYLVVFRNKGVISVTYMNDRGLDTHGELVLSEWSMNDVG